MSATAIECLRMFDWLIETPLLIWFFSGITAVKKPTRANLLGAAASLLALICLYPSAFNGSNIWESTFLMMVRFVYRMAFCALYLRLIKGIRWPHAAYFSGLYVAAYHSQMNISASPLIYEYTHIGHKSILQSMPADIILHKFVTFIICFAFFWVVRRSMDMSSIEHIGADRVLMLGAVSLGIVYTKGFSICVNELDASFGYTIEIAVLLILTQFILFGILISQYNYLRIRYDSEDRKVQELTNAYTLRSIRAWNVEQEDIRSLAHDMRNHLIAIKSIAERNGDREVTNYAQEILAKMRTKKEYLETGNVLLNSLISEKSTEAALDDIEISVVLDAKLIGFISSADLCTIFGNALDNAIEAARRVEDAAKRYIALRSTSAAGQVVLTITNVCETSTDCAQDAIPRTTKTDHVHHGFGLRNIRRVLRKYDGTLTIDTSTSGKFVLIITMPIP